MTETEREDDEILHLRLCLDFVDTVDWRKRSHPEDSLYTYADLIAWSIRQRLLNEEEGGHLLQAATQHPDQATAIFQQALDLREAIYRVFSAIAQQAAPNVADLDILNATLARGMAQARIARGGDRYTWNW